MLYVVFKKINSKFYVRIIFDKLTKMRLTNVKETKLYTHTVSHYEITTSLFVVFDNEKFPCSYVLCFPNDRCEGISLNNL